MKKFNLFKKKTEEAKIDEMVLRDEEGNPIVDVPEEKKKRDIKGLAKKVGLGAVGVAATGLIVLKVLASGNSGSDDSGDAIDISEASEGSDSEPWVE